MSFVFRASVKEQLHELADPFCKECDGEGVITIIWNNNPDREDESACDCTKREGAEEDIDGEAWDGGFAENH